MIAQGALALVVGPSGAGKDTLIACAREALAADARFAFPRRVVTRPVDAGGEAHVAISQAAFHEAERLGVFFLSWRSHDLAYALSADVPRALAAGRVVVANVSRGAIPAAEARALRVAVIEITAPLDILARRLLARGRETEAAISARLARAMPLASKRARVTRIDNSGQVEVAAAQLIGTLLQLADEAGLPTLA